MEKTVSLWLVCNEDSDCGSLEVKLPISAVVNWVKGFNKELKEKILDALIDDSLNALGK